MTQLTQNQIDMWNRLKGVDVNIKVLTSGQAVPFARVFIMKAKNNEVITNTKADINGEVNLTTNAIGEEVVIRVREHKYKPIELVSQITDTGLSLSTYLIEDTLF